MTITSIGRRARSAMALCAGAALLGLAACGTEAEAPQDSPAAASEGTTAEPTALPAPSDGASDGGGAQGQDDPSQNEGEASAAVERTRIMLRPELGLDDSSGEGAPVLPADDLAGLLAEPFGGTAECDDELVLEPGAAAVDCAGPANVDDNAQRGEWVAQVVLVPHEDGLRSGSRVAVLFSTGTEFPEAASELLEEGVVVTGVGFGSAFGMDPLSAEQLAESTLQTLTSEFAYVPVGEMADWTEVSCEEGLDFSTFETVDCEAMTADGESWQLDVAPGTYADNDQGLLVGIDTGRDG